MRHAYYWCFERQQYFEMLQKIPDFDSRWIVASYTPHWKTIHAHVAPHRGEINTGQYEERV
ncbi:MAG: hypothetical protein KDN22_10730 [Verrucomicrobiae bacterium]|nr:hypothetical protein [Verrucomicrobiae bacterium]